MSKVLLTSAARTATVSAGAEFVPGYRGIQVTIDVTDYPAAASVVPTIHALDLASGKVVKTLLTGAAIAGTGTTVLRVHPDLTQVAGVDEPDVVPDDWRLTLTHADTDSITYSAGVAFLG